ncbi:MAG: HEPN domain-containing protein [Promethearchaeota archaeon]
MDWFKQANAFLEDAIKNRDNRSYYLSCFLCHQAAEFGLKALCSSLDFKCWGHDLFSLINIIKDEKGIVIPEKLEIACKFLNKYYISTRYPDAYYSGAPFEQFTEFEANQAIEFSRVVIDFVRKQVL